MEYLLRLANLALEIYMWVIIARAIVSWVSPDPFNPVVRFLYRATEPVMRPVRRHLPPMGGLDLSPMIVILGIFLIQWLLRQMAYSISF